MDADVIDTIKINNLSDCYKILDLKVRLRGYDVINKISFHRHIRIIDLDQYEDISVPDKVTIRNEII